MQTQFAPASVTPTASAASDLIEGRNLQSPLAEGDTASILGGSVDELCLKGPTIDEEVTTKVAAPADKGLTPPSWATALVQAPLFDLCPCHPGKQKNERNIFCFTCTTVTGRTLCRHCLDDGTHDCGGGPLRFQIRRYMYQNVVLLEDLAPYYDLAGVQSYCINNNRAVLIQPKPTPPTAATTPAFAHRCAGCRVPLRPDCDFCSFKCKIDVDFGLMEPPTPGPAGARGPAPAPGATPLSAAKTRSRVGRGGSACLRVPTIDGSEGRLAAAPTRWGSEGTAGGCGSVAAAAAACKRRKLNRPLRSPMF